MEVIKSTRKFTVPFKKAGLRTMLKTHKVNGTPDYVSGFITNGEEYIYISVDTGLKFSYRPDLQFLWRFAKDEKDFRGEANHYAGSSKELIEMVIGKLKQEKERKKKNGRSKKKVRTR